MKGTMEVREKLLLLLALQGSPIYRGGRSGGPEGLEYLGQGGHMLAGLLLERKRRLDMQNLLSADQGKHFPAGFLCEWRDEMYPSGHGDTWWGKIP